MKEKFKFVCFVCQGMVYLFIFNKNKKNKIIPLGASHTPKKEPNTLIWEIVSPI